MNLKDRLLLDKLLEQMDNMRRPQGAGEVSFDTLAAISREREGWIGAIFQSLLRVIENSEADQGAEVHLQEVAAMALKWSSDLRQKRVAQSELPKAGQMVTVRVPEHRLRYLGKVTEDGTIYISFLDRTFTSAEVEIIPPKMAPPPAVESSLDFQHAIDNQMAFLRSRVFEKKS